MLQMMAADNDDAYAIMPGFILEVVRAAKSFVANQKTLHTGVEFKNCGTICEKNHQEQHPVIQNCRQSREPFAR